MKKFVLAALSAKFIHSSLALKYLSKFEGNNQRHHIVTAEFTINQRIDFILEELYRCTPDVLFFSCYIWNIEMVKQLCPALKKILSNCRIILGGPEVSYDSVDFLKKHSAVDAIIRGEGELTFTELLDVLDSDNNGLSGIKGITHKEDDEIFANPDRELLDLARLPFPYDDAFTDVQDKIIYYESSRGCPYRCAYCLSSVEKGVRFVPLEKVYSDLQQFLDAKVRQVKFVDRTFNCNRKHTMAVWEYLAAHDNGVTNFHFELTADLLDDEMIEFLRPLRKGLFQFEIGVQSTNPDTIRAINRNVDFVKLSAIVHKVKALENIHQHLDLIAGLPYEDYDSFANSFNDVYALAPEQLQLGFLKVLKGSPMHNRCEEFGIIYRDYAPYEVLSTRFLPYGDVLRLSHIEEMVELFYNSGKFLNSTEYLVRFFSSPFAFYERLSQHWIAGNNHYVNHSKVALCNILYEFVLKVDGIDLTQWMWLLKFDLCLHDKPKKLPDWLELDNNAQYRQRILEFYQRKENLEKYLAQYQSYDHKLVYKLAHIEVFGSEQSQHKAILFDYDHRDLLGNAAHYQIEL
ncbi:B12-binding domain-containing radical SAM protein [Hydrogenoanaerobacterium sp.]|uniref:B12-binding domain-containing radical SAM protein n=1 Tax=Hydrogenoanaerobacterium sp. TaxID=2953763 RepID=UPI00289B1CE3|nr:B12-binding domain-containing radical SAM protein [Hydrogenoanaerobacterium sp.]